MVSPRPGAAEAPGGGPVGLGEGVEDGALALLGDADARVAHREDHALRAVGVARHLDPHLAPLGELHRVAHEVHQELAHAHRVAEVARHHVVVELGAEADALLLRARRQELDRLLHHRAEREGDGLQGELAGLDLRQVEHVVEDGEQRGARAVRHLEVVALLGGEGGLERERGHPEHPVHRRPQLVAHVGEEHRLRPRRLLRRDARPHQGPLVRVRSVTSCTHPVSRTGRPCLVEDAARAPPHVALVAVGPHDAVLHHVLALALDRLAQPPLHRGDVVGVHQREARVSRGNAVLRVEAVDEEELARPDRPLAHEVGVEAPDVGRGLRLLQPPVLLRQPLAHELEVVGQQRGARHHHEERHRERDGGVPRAVARHQRGQRVRPAEHLGREDERQRHRHQPVAQAALLRVEERVEERDRRDRHQVNLRLGPEDEDQPRREELRRQHQEHPRHPPVARDRPVGDEVQEPQRRHREDHRVARQQVDPWQHPREDRRVAPDLRPHRRDAPRRLDVHGQRDRGHGTPRGDHPRHDARGSSVAPTPGLRPPPQGVSRARTPCYGPPVS